MSEVQPEPHANINHNKQRKRKRNKFLKNVQSFGKKGNYGHGTQLESEQFNYFSNILRSINEINDDKTGMANNVIEQTENKEIHLSSNQIVSKVIEALIGFTDEENFERFMTTFSEDLRPICSDRFASHVLQKIIEISFLRMVATSDENDEDGPPQKKTKTTNLIIEKDFNLKTEFSENHKGKCEKFFLSTSKFLLNNLEDFYMDPYANHLIRTSMLALAGFYTQKVVQNPNKKNDRTNFIANNIQIIKNPNDDSKEILQEYAKRLELWPHFVDLPYNKLSAALLANLLFAIKNTNKKIINEFTKKVIKCFEITEIKKEADDENGQEVGNDDKSLENSPKVFQTEPSCILLETMLLNCEYKFISQCYAKLFRGRIYDLAKGNVTNFTVQKLLDKIEISEFEEVFDALSDELETLLKIGHTGVVYSLANACLRLQTKQGAFMKSLNTALQVNSKDSENSTDLFRAVLKLKPTKIAKNDESNYINLHGSLIVQAILKYNKPIQMVNSILSQSSEELNKIFQSSLGSYCVDIFFESTFIGEKSKEKLIKLLDDNYMSLAINKYGSRVLEVFFKHGGYVQKEKIVKELAIRVNQLKGNLYGRFLYKNFNVETYKMSPASWKAGLPKMTKLIK